VDFCFIASKLSAGGTFLGGNSIMGHRPHDSSDYCSPQHLHASAFASIDLR